MYEYKIRSHHQPIRYIVTRGLQKVLWPGLQGTPSKCQGPPVITAPAVVGILLQLLVGCDDAAERLGTLQALEWLLGESLTHCAVDTGACASCANLVCEVCSLM